MGLISDLMKKKTITYTAEHAGRLMAQRLPAYKLTDEKRRNTEFEIALSYIQGFQRKESLGFVGKAMLINRFQWTLVEAGYNEEVARSIGRDITLRLNKKNSDHI